MKALFRLFDRTVYFLIFLCIAGFVTCSFLGIFFRFIVNDSLTWSEEVCRYLFVWMVFLGSAIGLLHRRHITIDVVPNFIPQKGKKFYNALIDIVIIVFCAFIIRYGYTFSMRGMRQGSPAMQIPLGYIYFGIVIGGAVMLINALRAMLGDLFAIPVDAEPAPAVEFEMSQEEFNKILGLESAAKENENA